MRSLSGSRRIARRGVVGAVVGLLGLLCVATAYLLVLLGAATIAGRHPRRARLPGRQRRPYVVVLIPAHNEAEGIGFTLASLARQDYSLACWDVVVVADNCDDRTAEVARAAGAMVYERHDTARRGKGHALRWALERLAAERPDTDAVLVIDADCEATPNLVRSVAARVARGAPAVQANYVVGNPAESPVAALRYAAFTLFNTVRPLGKDALGLSAPLLGTGMALSRALLAQVPWESASLVEDADYALRVVAAGHRIEFAPEAAVISAMPTSFRDARSQQMRWEGGRVDMVRRWTPLLVRDGLRRRRGDALVAGLEPLVPPQSLLLAGNAALLGLALLLRSRAGLRLAAANLAGQVTFVVGGLLLTGAPAAVYRALTRAPVLVAWKLWLYLQILAGRGPRGWVRTGRPASRANDDRRAG